MKRENDTRHASTDDPMGMIRRAIANAEKAADAIDLAKWALHAAVSRREGLLAGGGR